MGNQEDLQLEQTSRFPPYKSHLTATSMGNGMAQSVLGTRRTIRKLLQLSRRKLGTVEGGEMIFSSSFPLQDSAIPVWCLTELRGKILSMRLKKNVFPCESNVFITKNLENMNNYKLQNRNCLACHSLERITVERFGIFPSSCFPRMFQVLKSKFTTVYLIFPNC